MRMCRPWLGSVQPGFYMNDLPHDTWNFYLQRICNHCTYPACLAACPRQAIYIRAGARIGEDKRPGAVVAVGTFRGCGAAGDE